MPPRPKHNKRRGVAGPEEWACAFESEFDLFRDLDGAVELDAYGRPNLEAAREAWRRYGQEFLADFAARYPNGAHFVPWALAAFGEPR